MGFLDSNSAKKFINNLGPNFFDPKLTRPKLYFTWRLACLPSFCELVQLVGAAFGAAGQRCMALSTAVLVGEAKSWLPEVGITLVRFPNSLDKRVGEPD